MRHTSRKKLLVGTALPILLAFGLYGCDDTLTEAAKPQGTLDPSTIENPAGVEASLIATYRALDWFDDDGRNLVRRSEMHEDLFFDEGQ